MNLIEQIAYFVAMTTIDIAKREPVDCIMRSCTSVRLCGFPNNCSRKSDVPAQNSVKEK